MCGRWIILALVLLLASVLRLWDMDLMEFKADEAAVLALAQSDDLPSLGIQSSFGVENPPLFVWMIRIASWSGTDPIFLTALLAGGLGIAAVLLTFLVLYRRIGVSGAAAASLFLACGAHPVMYARKLWAQDLLPFFMTVLIVLLLFILERRRTRWLALLPVLVWALFSLHPTSLVVLPVVLSVLFIRRHELNGKALLLGSLPALIMALWYGYSLAGAHGHHSIREAGSAFSNLVEGTLEDRWVFLSKDVFEPAVEITTGADLSALLGSSREDFLSFASPRVLQLDQISAVAGVLLLLLGLLTAAFGMRDRGPTGRGAALLCLALVGSAVLVFVIARPGPFYPHYLLALYPAAFVVMALPFAVGGRKVITSVAALLLFLWCIGQVAVLWTLRDYLEVKGGTASGYGVVYKYKADVASWIAGEGFLLKNAPGPEYEFLIDQHSPVPDPIHAETSVTIYDGLDASGSSPSVRACPDGKVFGPLIVCPDP